jgi:uncharacterized repeat protein (TIGR01451 family)
VCTSGTVLTGCNIGPLASGANYSFTIQAQVPANFLSNLGLGTTNITNRVTVSADQFDPDNTNNTATATTTITESADVSVAKTCKPDTVVAQAGTNAFCSIVVTNNGPSFAQHVSLTDSIVGSTPFTIGTVTKTQGTCTSTSGASTSGTVTCNLGAIAAGGSATITVNFSANNGGSIDDTATVSASTPDPDTSNNTATGAVTFVSSADLLIVKTAAASVVPGTNLTYTISVANAGPSTATNVVVQDVLPVQVTMLSATPSVGSCTAGIPGNPGQPLTCTLGGMASGGSASITVVVKVAANTPNGTTISNNATVASDVGDPNNHNNSSTAYTTASTQADLSIVVTSDASTYKPSSIITYTVTVTNNGPSDAQAVVVTDNLPTFKQATYQSDTGGCTISSTVLTCVLGTMPVGTSKFFNIYELVNGNQGSVADTATVSSSNTDPSLANNTSIRTVTVGK